MWAVKLPKFKRQIQCVSFYLRRRSIKKLVKKNIAKSKNAIFSSFRVHFGRAFLHFRTMAIHILATQQNSIYSTHIPAWECIIKQKTFITSTGRLLSQQQIWASNTWTVFLFESITADCWLGVDSLHFNQRFSIFSKSWCVLQCETWSTVSEFSDIWIRPMEAASPKDNANVFIA